MTRLSRTMYFGVWGDSGHCLWWPTASRVRREEAQSLLPREFAGAARPGADPIARGLGPDGELLPGGGAQVEGLAHLHHACAANGKVWTAIAFWDRSGDGRPGSNSTFLLEGMFTFEAACSAAREAFPVIWKRFRFEVQLAPKGDIQ